MSETIPNGSNVTFDAMPPVVEATLVEETELPMEKNGDVLMDVSLTDTEKTAFETNQMDLDAEIEKGRLEQKNTSEKKEDTPNPEEILKKELTKEEQINIINSEINDINVKISDLESSTNEVVVSINSIRAMLGSISPLATIESTRTNTEKILELSKILEALIEKKKTLLESETLPIPAASVEAATKIEEKTAEPSVEPTIGYEGGKYTVDELADRTAEQMNGINNLETTPVPGMAEVAQTFNQEEHKN